MHNTALKEGSPQQDRTHLHLLGLALAFTTASFFFYEIATISPALSQIAFPLHYIVNFLGFVGNTYLAAETFFGSRRNLSWIATSIPIALGYCAHWLTLIPPDLAHLFSPRHILGFVVLLGLFNTDCTSSVSVFESAGTASSSRGYRSDCSARNGARIVGNIISAPPAPKLYSNPQGSVYYLNQNGRRRLSTQVHPRRKLI
jgi:hypothetical protein